MFEQAAGIDLTHVPYKGNGPAITDLLADRVQLLFTSLGPVEAHLKAGKLKAIAVTGKERLAALPGVQTVAENAIPGYSVHALVRPRRAGGHAEARRRQAERRACARPWRRRK